MISLDGASLTLDALLAIAAHDEPVAISPDARARVQASRDVVERVAAGEAAVYGVNTGFGSLADVKIPRESGLCGAYDGEEMSVRQDSLFNEHYDITTSDGRSWKNYVVTCNPALPIPTWSPAPGPRDPDCKLPPSGSTFCRREPSLYDGDVYGALDELIAEDRARTSPLVFDFNDRLAGAPEGWKIKNSELYVSEVLKKLKARGFCATSDGDEFFVKRQTNIFSETYDLVKAEGYSIRLYIVNLPRRAVLTAAKRP